MCIMVERIVEKTEENKASNDQPEKSKNQRIVLHVDGLGDALRFPFAAALYASVGYGIRIKRGSSK